MQTVQPIDGNKLPASQESVAAAAAVAEVARTAPPAPQASGYTHCVEAQRPMDFSSSAYGPFFSEPKETFHLWDAICNDARAPRWAAMGCIVVLVSAAAMASAVYFLYVEAR